MIRYTEDHGQEAYDLSLELTRIPAPPNHKERRAEFCANWFKAQDARGVCIDQALSVVYLAGVRRDRPVEVFMTYMGVVFPDEAELPLRVEGGRIYCLDAGDNTAHLVCLPLAGKYIAGYVDPPRQRGICGENTPGPLPVYNAEGEGLGNLKGVHRICEDYDDRTERFYTFDSSPSSIMNRAIGSKCLRVRARIQGGHSCNNSGGDNAIACSVFLVGELYGIRVPGGRKTTYSVGMILGGTPVSTIAQEAEMLYEFRSDRGKNLEHVERQFMKMINQGKSEGMDVSLEIIGVRPREGPMDPKRKQALSDWAHRVAEEITGQAPKHCADSTGCGIPLSLGILGMCVGNFRGAGAHTKEEYMETDFLEEGYKVAFGMILDNRS